MGRHTQKYAVDNYEYLVCIGNQTETSDVWVGDNGDTEGCGYAQRFDDAGDTAVHCLMCPDCGECLDPVDYYIGELSDG